MHRQKKDSKGKGRQEEEEERGKRETGRKRGFCSTGDTDKRVGGDVRMSLLVVEEFSWNLE